MSVRTGKSLFFPLVKLAVYFTELVVPKLVIVVKDFGGQIEQTGSFCDQWRGYLGRNWSRATKLMKWNARCQAKERKVPCSPLRSPFLSCKEYLSGVMPTGQRISSMSRSSASVEAPVSACVYLKHGEGFAICFRNAVSKAFSLGNYRTVLWDATFLTWMLNFGLNCPSRNL